MTNPYFGGLFRFLDWVLAKFDADRAARRRKAELKRQAEEIIDKHRRAQEIGVLRARDQQELADIMRISDQDERNRRLVEFDKRTRRR